MAGSQLDGFSITSPGSKHPWESSADRQMGICQSETVYNIAFPLRKLNLSPIYCHIKLQMSAKAGGKNVIHKEGSAVGL